MNYYNYRGYADSLETMNKHLEEIVSRLEQWDFNRDDLKELITTLKHASHLASSIKGLDVEHDLRAIKNTVDDWIPHIADYPIEVEGFDELINLLNQIKSKTEEIKL